MAKPIFEYDENDPRPYDVQYQEWLLCIDTIALDITTYPGSDAEQVSNKPNYKVITKRDRKS